MSHLFGACHSHNLGAADRASIPDRFRCSSELSAGERGLENSRHFDQGYLKVLIKFKTPYAGLKQQDNGVLLEISTFLPKENFEIFYQVSFFRETTIISFPFFGNRGALCVYSSFIIQSELTRINLL